MSATHTIERIFIKKVRHLEDVEIQIGHSENGTPKHLIITGPNGSGKTSLLEAMVGYLGGIPSKTLMAIEERRRQIAAWREKIGKFDEGLASAVGVDRDRLVVETNKLVQGVKYVESQLLPFDPLVLDIQDAVVLPQLYEQGQFILAHFRASRQNKMGVSTTIEKITPKATYRVDEEARQAFVKYIVSLKAKRSFARDQDDMATAEDIDAWFARFEGALRDIYEDAGLKLVFDTDTFAFRIQLSDGREPFDLNQLADGYQSILSIVTELILRMESGAPKIYDLPGIVLIDEIETHLHVSLQKKVLPFLTTFFPRVQFIVTSHSPFVLTSLENAVVYDLGSKMRVEDLTGYSSEAVLEGYFGQNKYSQDLQKRLARFRELSRRKAELSDAELDELDDLGVELHELPKAFSPELEDELRSIEEHPS